VVTLLLSRISYAAWDVDAKASLRSLRETSWPL
jgi:hypothetical protein